MFALINYYESSQNHYAPNSPEGFEIGKKNVLGHLDGADRTIPMSYLSMNKPTPPMLVFHGGRDMLAPFNQSVRLYECMKQLGKKIEFYKLDNAGHGYLGFDNDIIVRIMDEFLKDNI